MPPGTSDFPVEPLRSLASVACGLSVASAKERPNVSGANGCWARASRASAISVGFIINPEPEIDCGQDGAEAPSVLGREEIDRHQRQATARLNGQLVVGLDP